MRCILFLHYKVWICRFLKDLGSSEEPQRTDYITL